MIIFVNLVIAILSETYIRLANEKLGLFYDGVIEAIYAYKYSNFYGALIAAVPPFNLLILPFLPFFILIKNKKRLRCINDSLVAILFLPFGCIAAALFAVGNFLLAPIAYCSAIFQKGRYVLKRKISCFSFVYFITLGLPMMYLA